MYVEELKAEDLVTIEAAKGDNVVKIETTVVEVSSERDQARLDSIKEKIKTTHCVLVQALKDNDIQLFGQLMNASHVSLRDDYEVTGIELDTLVEEAWKVDGVIGSRMTGAGFGGCTVSIVKDEAIDTFKEQLTKVYEEKVGKTPEFYVVEVGDGPSRLV